MTLNPWPYLEKSERCPHCGFGCLYPTHKRDKSMAEQFELIPRVEEGSIIPQRLSDGYINATALCQSVGKTFPAYKATKQLSN